MTPTATAAPGAEAVSEEEEEEEASGRVWLPAGWPATCSGTEEGRGTAGGTIAAGAGGGEEDTTGGMEGITEAGEEEEDLGEVGEEEEDGVVVEGLGQRHRRLRPLLPAPGRRLDSEAPGGDRKKSWDFCLLLLPNQTVNVICVVNQLATCFGTFSACFNFPGIRLLE